MWEFAGIFADEALTGTKVKGRTEFQQMIQECEDGNLTINPKEAEVVRWIFESYLNGVGTSWIAKKLNEEGVPTKRTAKHWQESVIKEI